MRQICGVRFLETQCEHLRKFKLLQQGVSNTLWNQGLRVSNPKGRHQKARCVTRHLEVLSGQCQSRSIPGSARGRSLPRFAASHRGSGPSAFPSCMTNTSPLTPGFLLLIFKIGEKGYLLQKLWENCLQRIQAATFPTSSCISSSFLHCFPTRHLVACSILCLMPL